MINPIERFERSVFTKDIINKLRNDINLGIIPAEKRMLEIQLSQEYGVSRGPIRVALQTLAQEGLVNILSNGGAVVNGFSKKDAEDLFDLRYMLERRAVELILNNPMVSYAPILEVMEKMRAIHQKNVGIDNLTQLMSVHDIQFHHAIMTMAENNFMLKSWENISRILYTIMNIANLSYSSFFDFYKKHKELSDAIIQRNPNLNMIFDHHILGAKDLLIPRLISKIKT